VLHNKGVYPLPPSLHQQTTPRQVVNNFRSYHVTALLLAASVSQITKNIMRTTLHLTPYTLHLTPYALHQTVVCYQTTNVRSISEKVSK